MPYEATIRWIALGLLGLGVLWVVLAAIGLRPRAVRLRRAITRCGSATLVCGACGHPATSLGSIDTCPECGSVYTDVGLDGRRTASRWSPPLSLMAVLLLAAWAYGSLVLAPWSAAMANRLAYGHPFVVESAAKASYMVAGSRFDPSQVRPVIIEVALSWSEHAGAGASASVGSTRGGMVTVRVATGPAATTALNLSPTTGKPRHVRAQQSALGSQQGASTAPSPPIRWGPLVTGPGPAGPLPPLVGLWDAALSASPTVTLTTPTGSSAWTVHDSTGTLLDSGEGVRAGVAVLFEHAGLAPGGAFAWDEASEAGDTLAGLIDALGPPPAIVAFLSGGRPGGQLEFVEHVHAGPVWSLYHAHAPMGLFAAIATSASLLLLAAILFTLSWGATRHPRPHAQTATAPRP